MKKIASNFLKLKMKEGSRFHKYLIDTYNVVCKPTPRGYKVQYNDPWCATFVSVCAFMSCKGVEFYECSASKQHDTLCKLYPHGTPKVDPVEPEPGDLVYYSMKRNGYVDHVGIVNSVKGDILNVIEGNYHDMVDSRLINMLDDRIVSIVKVPK